jgi:hypothetical protein
MARLLVDDFRLVNLNEALDRGYLCLSRFEFFAFHNSTELVVEKGLGGSCFHVASKAKTGKSPFCYSKYNRLSPLRTLSIAHIGRRLDKAQHCLNSWSS